MAKLGSKKRPAVVRVQTFDRAEDVLAFCTQQGWKVIVGVEPDHAEDVADVEKLVGQVSHSQPPTRRISRNGPCPCGSGRKFKNCCAEQ